MNSKQVIALALGLAMMVLVFRLPWRPLPPVSSTFRTLPNGDIQGEIVTPILIWPYLLCLLVAIITGIAIFLLRTNAETA